MRTDGLADRRTDMTKLKVAFRNFAIARKNVHWRHVRPDGDYKYLMQSDLEENDRCSFGRTTFGISLTFVCCLFIWRISPHWARASSFLRFLDHTQRRTTVGRTPLDE